MEKEATDLKTLIHLMHANNIENNKIITTLQAENKQLNHKVEKLQKQNNMKHRRQCKPATKHQRHVQQS